jgi:RNA polymerase-binding transcription factor DksA
VSGQPDILDQAAELTQTLTDAYVSNAQEAAAPQQVQRADGTWPRTKCVDCDDPIPEPRLALGKVRCVSCQEDKERELRARGRT